MTRHLLAAAPHTDRNLLGQRLGRKGRDTRDRILAATQVLLVREVQGNISLSAIAREAQVGMTTLYLYFADLGEVILAALQPVIEDMASFMHLLEHRWPDNEVEYHARRFVTAHFDYWARHTHILHLRNSFADINDLRFLELRMEITTPLIFALIRQMDGISNPAGPPHSLGAAVVMLTGIERVATVTTGTNMSYLESQATRGAHYSTIDNTIGAHARILAITIEDQRRMNAARRQLSQNYKARQVGCGRFSDGHYT